MGNLKESNGCAGAVLGAGAGCAITLWRALNFVPTGRVYGDGMDRGFGIMGWVFVGVIVGCVLGAITGSFIKTK